MWFLWLFALGVGVYFGEVRLALIVSSLLAGTATCVKFFFPGRLITRLWFAFTLMAFAALLIQLSHGETEYHFLIFVLLSALLEWCD